MSHRKERDQLCGHKLRDRDTHCECSKAIRPCKADRNEHSGKIKSLQASTPGYLQVSERIKEKQQVKTKNQKERTGQANTSEKRETGGGGREQNENKALQQQPATNY